jgi:NCAIR mutase (PurE)-related protein
MKPGLGVVNDDPGVGAAVRSGLAVAVAARTVDPAVADAEGLGAGV